MSKPARVYVGLGSNLDDPVTHIERALDELDRLPLTRRFSASRLFVSRPVGPRDQPDFINAVAALDTHLSPLALLDQLQALEQRHGRTRQRRWGPRTLDLDLLLYEDQALQRPRLQVPHPEMTLRSFVMVPLAELTPDLELPDGRRIAAVAAELDVAGLEPVLPSA